MSSFMQETMSQTIVHMMMCLLYTAGWYNCQMSDSVMDTAKGKKLACRLVPVIFFLFMTVWICPHDWFFQSAWFWQASLCFLVSGCIMSFLYGNTVSKTAALLYSSLFLPGLWTIGYLGAFLIIQLDLSGSGIILIYILELLLLTLFWAGLCRILKLFLHTCELSIPIWLLPVIPSFTLLFLAVLTWISHSFLYWKNHFWMYGVLLCSFILMFIVFLLSVWLILSMSSRQQLEQAQKQQQQRAEQFQWALEQQKHLNRSFHRLLHLLREVYEYQIQDQNDIRSNKQAQYGQEQKRKDPDQADISDIDKKSDGKADIKRETDRQAFFRSQIEELSQEAALYMQLYAGRNPALCAALAKKEPEIRSVPIRLQTSQLPDNLEGFSLSEQTGMYADLLELVLTLAFANPGSPVDLEMKALKLPDGLALRMDYFQDGMNHSFPAKSDLTRKVRMIPSCSFADEIHVSISENPCSLTIRIFWKKAD